MAESFSHWSKVARKKNNFSTYGFTFAVNNNKDILDMSESEECKHDSLGHLYYSFQPFMDAEKNLYKKSIWN